MTKKCSKCGKAKGRSEFYRFVHSPDGLAPACKACRKVIDAEYRAANREILIAKKKENYQANREARLAVNRQWRERHPERFRFLVRKSWLMAKYGLTPEGYDAILVAQGSMCGICGRVPREGDRKFHVDHDHDCCPGKRTCGKCIRGILCSGCNTSLGWFEKNGQYIEKYLKGNQYGH